MRTKLATKLQRMVSKAVTAMGRIKGSPTIMAHHPHSPVSFCHLPVRQSFRGRVRRQYMPTERPPHSQIHNRNPC